MATPEDLHFYADIFTKLNATLQTYVNQTAQSVITAISPACYTLLTVYVVLWGWAMMRGTVQEPVQDAAARIIRMSIITGISLTLGNYNMYVTDLLWNAPDAMAAVVASGNGDAQGNSQFLDDLMTKMFVFGDAFWQKANANSTMGIPDIGLSLYAMGIWGVGLLTTAFAAFLLVLAKIAMAILLGLGPMFIFGTLFEPTKKFLDAWLGQTLNYFFLVVLTAALIKLMMTVLLTYLVAIESSGVLADPKINQALPAVAISVIAALLMTQLPSIASSLGGGVAISTLGAAGWAFNKLKGSVSGTLSAGKDLATGKTLLDARKFRRDKATHASWAKKMPGRTAKAAGAVWSRVENRRSNKISKK
ncbi:type IV secretion system protein [Janthinobacterium sp. FW305-128]|uniref:type IV secretion system protein n=1 Tax=Janthinobacterium sp. FW305-128 TaxID=2775055 RepID=UPI001E3C87CC|nr:type IV secretion system protein [Janthinobacterium sp. FW305-128]MCC7684724.1 type IV secretion system protein [Janthinobacterium sp. FW305-128]